MSQPKTLYDYLREPGIIVRMDGTYIKKAEALLSQADPSLGALIRSQQLSPRTKHTDYFAALCRSIIGQQVSVAAASSIFMRFEAATKLSPYAIADLSPEDMRSFGLSRQKAGYLQDLARHFVDNPALYNHLEQQSDEQVIIELTAVKGIGEWTAQMFLMFTLERPDVFAPDDVGLQRAMMSLYGWTQMPTRIERMQVADTWRPYRTIACLHLWQSLNNDPQITAK